MRYRAVVFDLDGTLVDSLEDLAASGNELLAGYGKPPHVVDEYRYFVGNGSRTLIERLLPETEEPVIKEALAKYKEIYARSLLRKTKPYPGILALLTDLQKRQIPMAVCTNKHPSAAETVIGTLFPSNIFNAYVGDRSGVPRKPDPANLFYVLEKLGVSPKETAYLGDTSVDMQTAVRAGALSVGVLWGFRDKAELLASGAQVLLAHPAELLTKVDFV